MSADLQQRLDGIPAIAAYGLRIERTDDGVRVAGDLGADAAVSRKHDTAHGGVVASVLDTAATFAIVATSNARWVTVDLRVDYLRPTSLGPVSCRAWTVTEGGRLGVVQAELAGADGRVTALAVATMSRAAGSAPA